MNCAESRTDNSHKRENFMKLKRFENFSSCCYGATLNIKIVIQNNTRIGSQSRDLCSQEKHEKDRILIHVVKNLANILRLSETR
mgnify:CR=1 FL=1